MLVRKNQHAARAACRIVNAFSRLRIQNLNKKLDNFSRRVDFAFLSLCRSKIPKNPLIRVAEYIDRDILQLPLAEQLEQLPQNLSIFAAAGKLHKVNAFNHVFQVWIEVGNGL